MGSGKTTLAQQLARTLDYTYIAESAHAKQYLSDLFNNPKRWAFETQVAFLLHKAVDISKALERSPGVVIDRTLAEDIEIFASYFYEEGHIDDRAFDSYKSLASYFESEIGPPELIIYCDCTLNKTVSRIGQRGRADRDNHSDDFISNIYARYEAWLSTYHATSIYRADSERWDWRNPEDILKVVKDLGIVYSREYFRAQFDLFTDAEQYPSGTPEVLKPHYLAIRKNDSVGYFSIPTGGSGLLPYPAAYIAAPFTSFASPPSDSDSELFEKPHGEIKRGRFRNALLSIEKSLKNSGISSLIPHRDVNQWGKLTLEPNQVALLCSEQVSRTDLFVGLIAESHGAHYEFGLARGLGKPCIVIHCDELSESFIGSGFDTDGVQILSLKCQKVSDIAKILESEKVREFLARYF
jgi:deoxyadenosine/deoxycytidine kinase